MAWVTITEDDVLTTLSEADLSSLRAAHLQAGQDDPVLPTIALVTALVRGYCCQQVALGAAGTVPDTIKLAALDIIAVRLFNRLSKDPGQRRQAAHDKALQLLQDVADRKFRLEEDTAARITISAPDRQITRETLAGL